MESLAIKTLFYRGWIESDYFAGKYFREKSNGDKSVTFCQHTKLVNIG